MVEAPLGTILVWVPRAEVGGNTTAALPAGWVRCDGAPIPSPSPWAGHLTPDLNGGRRFLRGGGDGEALELEEHQVEEHLHTDPGHSHTATSSSPPHAHGFKDFYIHETEQDDLHGSGYPIGYLAAASSATEKVAASVSTVVAAGATGMGGVAAPARHGAETRPRNMKVVYVIRVW